METVYAGAHRRRGVVVRRSTRGARAGTTAGATRATARSRRRPGTTSAGAALAATATNAWAVASQVLKELKKAS